MSCTANYRNTFISVAEDCPATMGEIPPARAVPTVARRYGWGIHHDGDARVALFPRNPGSIAVFRRTRRSRR